MKTSSLILLAALALAMAGAGAEEAAPLPLASMPLWAGPAPGEPAVPAKSQGMESSNGVLRAHDVAQPVIAVYAPPAAQRTGTAVVVCPGGGYAILAMDLEGSEVVRWLNSCGVTAVLLTYRVPARAGHPPWQAAVQDVQRALSTVRSHAAEWDIASGRVGAIGFSAGGHALAVSAAGALPRQYPAADAIDAFACRPDFALLIYPAYMVAKGTMTLNPEVKPAAGAPPTFIVYAEDDPLGCENGMAYMLALKDLAIPAELHIYPAGGHGFGLRPTPQPTSTWPARAREWLQGRGLLTPAH